MVGSRRELGWLSMLCCLALLIQVAARAASSVSDGASHSGSIEAEIYIPGPVGREAPPRVVDLPRGAEELFGLSVLAAFLYGFRASGLARASSRPDRRTDS